LLIGVSDSGVITGLEKDYRLLGKKGNADRFELKLRALLKDKFHPEPFGLVDITFHTLDAGTICHVGVRVSAEIHHLDECVFIRDGNQTLKLSGPALTRWVKSRVAGNAGHSVAERGTPAEMEIVVDLPEGEIDSEEMQESIALVESEPENPIYEEIAETIDRNEIGSAREAGPSANSIADISRERPRPIDDYSTDELIGEIRGLFSERTEIEREEAIRLLAAELGFRRLGENIRETLTSALKTAVRRGVLFNESGIYMLSCVRIEDFAREHLTELFLAAMGRGWCEREEAIRAAARYLGFRRTGKTIQETFKSIINGGLRKGLLEKDGTLIRRVR